MQELAPELWDLLGLMLTANSREAQRKTEANAEGDIEMDEQPVDEAEYWRDYNEEFFVEDPTESSSDPDRMAKRRKALLKIVSSS